MKTAGVIKVGTREAPNKGLGEFFRPTVLSTISAGGAGLMGALESYNRSKDDTLARQHELAVDGLKGRAAGDGMSIMDKATLHKEELLAKVERSRLKHPHLSAALNGLANASVGYTFPRLVQMRGGELQKTQGSTGTQVIPGSVKSGPSTKVSSAHRFLQDYAQHTGRDHWGEVPQEEAEILLASVKTAAMDDSGEISWDPREWDRATMGGMIGLLAGSPAGALVGKRYGETFGGGLMGALGGTALGATTGHYLTPSGDRKSLVEVLTGKKPEEEPAKQAAAFPTEDEYIQGNVDVDRRGSHVRGALMGALAGQLPASLSHLVTPGKATVMPHILGALSGGLAGGLLNRMTADEEIAAKQKYHGDYPSAQRVFSGWDNELAQQFRDYSQGGGNVSPIDANAILEEYRSGHKPKEASVKLSEMPMGMPQQMAPPHPKQKTLMERVRPWLAPALMVGGGLAGGAWLKGKIGKTQLQTEKLQDLVSRGWKQKPEDALKHLGTMDKDVQSGIRRMAAQTPVHEMQGMGATSIRSKADELFKQLHAENPPVGAKVTTASAKLAEVLPHPFEQSLYQSMQQLPTQDKTLVGGSALLGGGGGALLARHMFKDEPMLFKAPAMLAGVLGGGRLGKLLGLGLTNPGDRYQAILRQQQINQLQKQSAVMDKTAEFEQQDEDIDEKPGFLTRNWKTLAGVGIPVAGLGAYALGKHFSGKAALGQAAKELEHNTHLDTNISKGKLLQTPAAEQVEAVVSSTPHAAAPTSAPSLAPTPPDQLQASISRAREHGVPEKDILKTTTDLDNYMGFGAEGQSQQDMDKLFREHLPGLQSGLEGSHLINMAKSQELLPEGASLQSILEGKHEINPKALSTMASMLGVQGFDPQQAEGVMKNMQNAFSQMSSSKTQQARQVLDPITSGHGDIESVMGARAALEAASKKLKKE